MIMTSATVSDGICMKALEADLLEQSVQVRRLESWTDRRTKAPPHRIDLSSQVETMQGLTVRSVMSGRS